MPASFTRSVWTIGLLGVALSACDSTPVEPEPGTPELVLEPTSVNVGEIDVGGEGTALLTVHNVGTGTAQIQRVSVAGSAEIGVLADPCTGALAAGDSCTVSLVIRPAVAGALAAELAIETATGALAVRVAATGRAFVAVEPIGAVGQVTSDPPGITCGAGAGACRAAFTVPRIVLRASDDVTIRWSGACAGHGDCALVLDRSPDVTAAMFAPLVVTLAESTTRTNLGYGIAIDPSNRMIVTGEGPGPLTGVARTVALTPDGRIVWEDLFDPGVEGHDAGRAVAVDADGNVVVAGQWFSSSNTRFNAFIRKLSPTGAPFFGWGHENEDVGDDGYRGLAIDHATGAIYVVGYRPDPSDGPPTLHSQGWIRRLDAQGKPVWSRTWQGSADGDDLALAVALDPAGNPIVVGRTATIEHGADAWIAAYSPDGDLLWSDERGGDGTDEAAAIAVAADGTFSIAGTRAGAGWIARYDANHQRAGELASPEVAGWQGAAFDPAGELVVTGDAQTRVYTTDLQPVWSREHRELHAQEVAIDRDGNVVVVGWVDNDITVVKYFQ